jgi:hypothetical protein
MGWDTKTSSPAINHPVIEVLILYFFQNAYYKKYTFREVRVFFEYIRTHFIRTLSIQQGEAGL